jgi:hypothetical protein
MSESREIQGDTTMREYKRKGPRPWRDKDKRMAAAVRLRAEGKSLREIAKELAVGVATIHRDLARWDAQQNVVSLFQSGVPSRPQRGNLEQSNGTAEAPVTPIGRRLA